MLDHFKAYMLESMDKENTEKFEDHFDFVIDDAKLKKKFAT